MNPSHVYVVCHGKGRDCETGDFYKTKAYMLHRAAAIETRACMEKLGGKFKLVFPTDGRHVIEQWVSKKHTVWLEILRVT